MFLTKQLENEVKTTIVVRQITKERLSSKSFRGIPFKCAGNFSRWDSAESLFRDELVLRDFLLELGDLWKKQDFGTHSLTIEHTLIVGWASTDSLDNYAPDDLEKFNLNRRSWGLRVKFNRTDLCAPQTRELTIVFEFKSEGDHPVAVVHSIYPGGDVGKLVGNVTTREKCVFFDWSHPGKV